MSLMSTSESAFAAGVRSAYDHSVLSTNSDFTTPREVGSSCDPRLTTMTPSPSSSTSSNFPSPAFSQSTALSTYALSSSLAAEKASPILTAFMAQRVSSPRSGSSTGLMAKQKPTECSAVGTSRQHTEATPHSQRRPSHLHQRKNTTSAIFSDKLPLNALHNERAYLRFRLEQESFRMNYLIEQHTSAEAELQAIDTSRQRRRVRKRVSHLTTQINGTKEQQRLAFGRLGELFVEIEAREKWAMARRQTMPQLPTAAALGPHSSDVQPASPMCLSMLPDCFESNDETSSISSQESSLGSTPASSFTFVPGDDGVGCSRDHGAGRCGCGWITLETVAEVVEDGWTSNHGLGFEFCSRAPVQRRGCSPSSGAQAETVKGMLFRRPSLPNMRTTSSWSHDG